MIKKIIKLIYIKLFKKKKETILTDDIFDNDIKQKTDGTNYTELEKLFINDTKEADILLVKMDEKTIKKNSVNKEHQTRPFIKLSEDNTSIYGYYTTSNIQNIQFNKSFYSRYKFVISAKKYKIHKNSLVNHAQFIQLSKENIKHKIDTLTNYDLTTLIKLSSLLRGQKIYSEGKNKFFDQGDIIEYNSKLYLIYQTDSSNIYTYNIEKTNTKMSYKDLKENNKYYKIENIIYKLNYEDTLIFLHKDNLLLTDIIILNDFIKIENKRKAYKYEKKSKSKTKSKSSPKYL